MTHYWICFDSLRNITRKKIWFHLKKRIKITLIYVARVNILYSSTNCFAVVATRASITIIIKRFIELLLHTKFVWLLFISPFHHLFLFFKRTLCKKHTCGMSFKLDDFSKKRAHETVGVLRACVCKCVGLCVCVCVCRFVVLKWEGDTCADRHARINWIVRSAIETAKHIDTSRSCEHCECKIRHDISMGNNTKFPSETGSIGRTPRLGGRRARNFIHGGFIPIPSHSLRTWSEHKRFFRAHFHTRKPFSSPCFSLKPSLSLFLSFFRSFSFIFFVFFPFPFSCFFFLFF